MVKDEGRETVKMACERAISRLHPSETVGTHLEPTHIQLNLGLALSNTLEYLLEALHQLLLSLLACAELLLTRSLLRLVQRLAYPSYQVTLVDILVVDLDEIRCSEDDEPGNWTAREGDFDE
jgi:hypothetical protein